MEKKVFAGSARNLRAVFEQATAEELRAGMAWYLVAHDEACRLAGEYQITLGSAAGVIAALSPRSKWARNVIDAENLIRAYVTGEPTSSVKVCTFSRNRDRAVEILDHHDPGRLSGPKVRAFCNCIRDPQGTSEVCVDSHAFNAWLGYRAIVGGDGPRITENRFDACAADYVKLARELGIKPHQCQAVIWLVWRRLIGETSS